MPFAAKPADASSAGKAGISFTDTPLLSGRTLDISAGYMLWSPKYVPVSNINISATYCPAEKISFSIDGMYGIGNDSGQMNIGLGAGYRMTDFLAARINLRYLSENLTPEVSYGALGAEAKIADMISVRAGYRYVAKYVLPSFATLGIGAKFAGIRIDAAYLFANEVIGNTTAISLGYCF